MMDEFQAWLQTGTVKKEVMESMVMSNSINMYLLLGLFICSGCALAPGAAAQQLSGERAMDHVRAQVAFGPRPPGSEALEKCRAYLIKQLESYGYQVDRDSFTAETPYGPRKMVNLIARKKGNASSVIALASHYDTKYFEDIRFVGANDAGSSTGLLLELARVLASRNEGFDYWFVFLDGEEAFVEWSLAGDGTYGSRHLAGQWKANGTADKVRALILLDMVGDRKLDIQKESNSTPWLMDLVWNTAVESGMSSDLSPGAMPSDIQDDHIHFVEAGIPSVDIISWNYKPWHTAGDTLDKISAASLEKVGKLVLNVLPKIEQRFSRK